MTTPVWPEDLGTPFQYGFQITPYTEGTVQSSDFDAGPSRDRVRFTNVPSLIQGLTMAFTDEKFELFKGFFFADINMGTKYFNVNLPVGQYIALQRCKWVRGSVKWEATTYNRWTVTGDLEVRTLAVMDGAMFYLYTLWGESFTFSLADSIQEAVNEDYPTSVEAI